MKYDPDVHHRRSIRWKGFDYSAAGAYFVTVCVQGRECFFGKMVGGEMVMNAAGKMVQSTWETLPERFPHLALDECVVMPNHFHGILWIVGAPLVGAPGQDIQKPIHTRADARRAGTRPAPTLGDIVGAFKSLSTNAYIEGVNNHGWPPFAGRLWQRNYYERVIRDEEEMRAARQYIRENPATWDIDAENPAAWGAILVIAGGLSPGSDVYDIFWHGTSLYSGPTSISL